MKKLITVRVLPVLLLVLFANVSFGQHFSPVWTGNPYNPMNFVIQKATINGTDLVAGDEIAVFDIGNNGKEICVGTTVLTKPITVSSPASFAAGEDEPGGGINGYTQRHKIIFKLWDSHKSKEITSVFPTYNPSFDTVYANLGTALVTSLAGYLNIETSIDSLAACTGNITVPVKVKNLYNIEDFNLILSYGTGYLKYVGYQNVNMNLNGNLTVKDSNGSINISWHSTQPANIDTGSLLELKFMVDTVYVQTTKSLSWDTKNSYYKNSGGTKPGTNFSDGTITIHPLPAIAGSINGSDSLYIGAKNISYNIQKITNATGYVWTLSPAYAGTITKNDTSVIVDFSDTVTGQVVLSVSGTNSCGSGKTSSLTIHLVGNVTASAGANDTICETKVYTLGGSASNYKSVGWKTLGDGVFDDTTLLTATYTSGAGDISAGFVKLVLTAYALLPHGNNAADTMTLSIVHVPIANAGSNDTICENEAYTLNGSAENYTSVVWRTNGDGTFSDSTILDAVYTPGKADKAADSVVLTLIAKAKSNHCQGTMDAMILYLKHAPDKPKTPQGQNSIMEGTDTVSQYTIPAVKYAVSYQWFLDPKEAGDISGTVTTGKVTWNSDYTGTQAYIYVAASNGYCDAVSSDSLKISLSPVGIPQYNTDNNIIIVPNPSHGRITITLKDATDDYNLMIIDLTGKVILQKELKIQGNQFKFSIDMSDSPSGIYYLRFVGNHNTIMKKIMINKSY